MKIGKTRLEVFYGDITGANVEAVVNPANNMLWMGGGVSAAIRKVGGESIETEVLAMAPAEIGSAVTTGSGTLTARRVIHAVISGQDLTANEEYIRKAVRTCYKKADEIKCRSIAMPLLTTAVMNIEIHVVAHIIVNETVDYLVNEESSLERVVFVEYDKSVKDVFKTTLMEKFTKHG